MSKCMSDGRSLYRIYDPDPKKSGMLPVKDFSEATYWNGWDQSCELEESNGNKWGIFWTVNEFTGSRKKENCTRIISWAVDIDLGLKTSQLDMIKSHWITPSMIIETKNGFHVYYDALPGADPKNYSLIVEGLIEAFNGDPNAKDVSRVLRVPTFTHWKNPDDPYSVRVHEVNVNVAYTEKEMFSVFGVKKKATTGQVVKQSMRRELSFQSDGELFERIYNLDCEQALLHISGSKAVNGEAITFKKTSSGNLNIVVNGKTTSCFVDKQKRIGSSDKGGPTIWQWVNWYHRDHKKTYKLLKQFMPEVFENGRK